MMTCDKFFSAKLPSLSDYFFYDKKTLAIVTFIFFLFFLIELVTPFHSDDFGYAQLQGLQPHINQYLNWSGRIVADISASTLLSLPHFVVSLILAALATSLCFLITIIPDTVFNCRFSAWRFLLISSLYWICNPTLGQMNFWVVGACNYLVTTFSVALILYLIVRFRTGFNPLALPFVAFLAFIAGCSNENTTIALIYAICALTAFELYDHLEFSRKSRFLILICIILGASVLILSPGNFARLNHPAFADWRSMSNIQQLFAHLTRSRYYFDLFEFLLSFLVIGIITVRSYAYSDVGRRRLVYSLIFLSASFVALLVMFKSPVMPLRSYSGMFFYLLLSLSFILDPRLFKGAIVFGYKLLAICSGVVMLLSFFLTFTTYTTTKIQEEIRNGHINYEKLLHGSSASPTIPSYFFSDLLRGDKDKFDLYHSESQAPWFRIKNLGLKQAHFDYSVIRTGRQIKAINHSGLSDIKVYVKKGMTPIQKSTLVVESPDPSPIDKIHVKFYRNRDKEPVTLTLSDPIELMGKKYFGITDKIRHFDQINSVIVE